jgi:hypothetical protein
VLVRDPVELSGRDPGVETLGDQLERLGDDRAGSGHASDLTV